MIIQYDRNPSLSIDEKIQSLIESIQMALNELNDEAAPIIKAIQMLSKDTAVTAKVERVANGVKITITDINGTTEEIVYEAIEDVIFNQNGSFTFVFPDGRTYTSASLIGPAGPQGERGPQGLPGPQGVPGEVGETGNGIADAKLNSDYTLTITFTDGTSYTTPSIRGLQGEQGIQGIQGVRGERGETGSKGDTGEAAGFGTPTASVDSNVGTPSVVVTASGADTAKVFDFAFHNLKGQQGEQGIRGIQGPKGDTFTYDDLTAAQKAEIKANLRSFYKKSESNYVTTLASETTIPIGITGFRATDILFVDINGLDLIESEDYTISGTNIVLNTPITGVGTVVHFVALRAVEIAQEDYSALKGDTGERGPQGVKGDTGDAAGFGNVTATVDSNTGTPSVTVTASGSDTAKNFSFEFRNLKGAKGDAGDAGDYSALSNKPQINSVTLVGNKTSEQINVVDMTNPKFNLDTTATSGTDKEIYDALVTLGWTDVIV